MPLIRVQIVLLYIFNTSFGIFPYLLNIVICLVAYNNLSIVIGTIFEIFKSEAFDQFSKYELFNLLLMLSFLFRINQQKNMKYRGN